MASTSTAAMKAVISMLMLASALCTSQGVALGREHMDDVIVPTISDTAKPSTGSRKMLSETLEPIENTGGTPAGRRLLEQGTQITLGGPAGRCIDFGAWDNKHKDGGFAILYDCHGPSWQKFRGGLRVSAIINIEYYRQFAEVLGFEDIRHVDIKHLETGTDIDWYWASLGNNFGHIKHKSLNKCIGARSPENYSHLYVTDCTNTNAKWYAELSGLLI